MIRKELEELQRAVRRVARRFLETARRASIKNAGHSGYRAFQLLSLYQKVKKSQAVLAFFCVFFLRAAQGIPRTAGVTPIRAAKERPTL